MTPDQNPPWNKQNPAKKQGGPAAWAGAKQPPPGKKWNKQDPAWVGVKQPPPDKSLLLQTELEAAIKADHKKPWREEATYPELQKALAAPEEITGTQMLGAMMIGFAGGYRGDPTAGAKFMKDMIQKREDLAWVKADARSMYEVDPSSLSPEMLRGLAEGTYKDRGSWVAAKSSYRGEVAKAKAKQSDSRTEAFIRESIEGIDPEKLSPTERDQFDWLVATLPEPETPLTSQEIEMMGARLERIQEGVASREIVVDQLSKLSDEEALNLYSQLADTLPLDELLSVQDAQNPKKVREYLEGKAQDFSHSDVVKGFASAELAQNSSVKRAQKDVAASSPDNILKLLEIAASEGLTITEKQATGQEPISESEEAQFLKVKAATDAYVAADMKKADAVVSVIEKFNEVENINRDLWDVDAKGTWTSNDPVQQGILGQLNGIIQKGLDSVSSRAGKEAIRQAEAVFHANTLGGKQAREDLETAGKVRLLMAERRWSEAQEFMKGLPQDVLARINLGDKSGQSLLQVVTNLAEAEAALAGMILEVEQDENLKVRRTGSVSFKLDNLVDMAAYEKAKSDPGTPSGPMSYLKPNQIFSLSEMQELQKQLEKEKGGAVKMKTFQDSIAYPIHGKLSKEGKEAWDSVMSERSLENWADADSKKTAALAERAFRAAIDEEAYIDPTLTEEDYEDPTKFALPSLLGKIGRLRKLEAVVEDGQLIPRELAKAVLSTIKRRLKGLEALANLYQVDKSPRLISVSEIRGRLDPEAVPRLRDKDGLALDPTNPSTEIPKGFTRDIVNEGQRALMEQVGVEADDIGKRAHIRYNEETPNTLPEDIDLRLAAGDGEGTKGLLNTLSPIMVDSSYVFLQGATIGGEAAKGMSLWLTYLPGIDDIYEGGEFTEEDEAGLLTFVTKAFGFTDDDKKLTADISLLLKSNLQRSLGDHADERAYEGFNLATYDRFQDAVRKSFLEHGKFDSIIKTMFGDDPTKDGFGKLNSSEQSAVISHFQEASSSLSASFVSMGEQALYGSKFGPYLPANAMEEIDFGRIPFGESPLMDAILGAHGMTSYYGDREYMINMMAVMRGLPWTERLDDSDGFPVSLGLGLLLRGAHPGDREPSKSRVKRD